jgi:hypothetical protein
MKLQAKRFRRGGSNGRPGRARSVGCLKLSAGKGGSAQEQEYEQEGKESFHGGPPLNGQMPRAAHQNLK